MTPPEDPILEVGRIKVVPDSYEVYVDRERVELTLTQFRLLSAMARRPGWVLTAEQFRERFGKGGGGVSPPGSRSVKHHIAALRRKLGPAAWQVQTVRGEGYRLTHISTPSTGDPRSKSADPAD